LVEVAQRRAWNAALEDKRKREQRERRNRERGL
jgi:hypothetical protein